MNKKLFYITSIVVAIFITYFMMLAFASTSNTLPERTVQPTASARISNSYVDESNTLHIVVGMDIPYGVYSGIIVDFEAYDAAGGGAKYHSTVLK